VIENLITNRTEWPTISEYKHNFDFSWLQLYTENANKSCYRTVAPWSVGLNCKNCLQYRLYMKNCRTSVYANAWLLALLCSVQTAPHHQFIIYRLNPWQATIQFCRGAWVQNERHCSSGHLGLCNRLTGPMSLLDAIFYYRLHSGPVQYGTWFSRDHYIRGRSKRVCRIMWLATAAHRPPCLLIKIWLTAWLTTVLHIYSAYCWNVSIFYFMLK